MVNKKRIAIVILLISAAILIGYTEKRLVAMPEISSANVGEPIEIPQTTSQELPEIYAAEDEIVCDISSNKEYGGIGGSVDIPPNGTTIDQSLTDYYGRPTTTGICGTYWYVAGWWFNDTEMHNLPYESIMYGMSPYAITTGGRSSGTSNIEDGPIAPVPEIASIVLVASGVSIFLIWRKIANNKR